MPLSTTIVVVVLVVLLAAIAFAALRLARTRRLRTRFGPEYERSMHESDDRSEAEDKLLDREQRHDEMEIRPLDPAARERFASRWLAVQERFDDAPVTSVQEADRLVTELMNELGYPTDEGFEQRLADLSVAHATTLDDYCQARRLIARLGTADAAGDDLWQAMVCYRRLFTDLLSEGEPETASQ